MDKKTRIFEQHRSELTNIAYGMLGRLSDARDIVQEAYIRWDKVDLEEVNKPATYLKTIISRLCIDHFRSAKQQREEYYGPWLPEPIYPSDGRRPDAGIELHNELTIALLHLLENLNPDQRAIYLLHDIFDYKFSEIAELLDKNPAACRKAAQRARTHIQKNRPRVVPSTNDSDIVQQFVKAIRSRDMNALQTLLAKDARMYSDGGGEVTAAPKPIQTSSKISKFLLSIAEKNTGSVSIENTRVNGRPGFKSYINGKLHSIWSFCITGDKIERIYAILNPSKIKPDTPM